jgi:DNA invertase Pin-like site-specific DNA recombinase
MAVYHRPRAFDPIEPPIRERLREAVLARGGNVPNELFIEESGSGAPNNRAGLLQLKTAAAAGRLATVFCWSLDRLGSSVLDMVCTLEALRQGGVEVHAVGQALELKASEDPRTEAMFRALQAAAEFERSLLRERTRAGLAEARQRGVRLGRPPGRAPDAREVARLREAGLSWREIASRLGCATASARRALSR